MASRSHGNARREVKELVAIDIGHDHAAAALRYQRVRPRIGRRNVLVIARQNAFGIGAGQGGLDLGAGNQSLGWHRNSPPSLVIRRWFLAIRL